MGEWVKTVERQTWEKLENIGCGDSSINTNLMVITMNLVIPSFSVNCVSTFKIHKEIARYYLVNPSLKIK